MPKTLETVCPGCGAHLLLSRQDIRNFKVEVAPAPPDKPPVGPDEETSLLDEIFGEQDES